MRTRFLLAVEEGLGQGFGQLGLGAGGPQERKWSRWAYSGSAMPPGSGGWPRSPAHGLVLAHHPPVEEVLLGGALLPAPPPSSRWGITGPPSMIRAISSSVTLSRRGAGLALVRRRPSSASSAFLASGLRRIASCAAFSRFVLPAGPFSRAAFGGLQAPPAALDLRWPPSRPLGFLGVEVVPLSDSSFVSPPELLLDQLVGLLFQGGPSISCWIIFR